MSVRTMSVAGSFYPEHPSEIRHMIDHFNSILKSHPDAVKGFDSLIGRAVIVPHAGWIYSGFTANLAHKILTYAKPKTIVVIGPSHRVGFQGVSICDMDSYETPLGNLNINRELVKRLRQDFSLPYFPQAHQEHSTEVQMPFIKNYLPDVHVVELVYAYAQPEDIEPIITYLLSLKDTVVVISTDLSHYYPLQEAQKFDSICLEAIRDEDTEILNQGCEACGIIGVKAMLNAARKNGLISTILDYRTSADASGDTSRVVGYMSAIFH